MNEEINSIHSSIIIVLLVFLLLLAGLYWSILFR
jgi:hypothetical protein